MDQEEAYRRAQELGGRAVTGYKSACGWVLMEWGGNLTWIVVSKDKTRVLDDGSKRPAKDEE